MMRGPRRGAAAAALVAALVGSHAHALFALEARILEVRNIGESVRASVDLRDVLSDKLREMLQSGSAVHVRIQAEMWEDRPVWDKLVRPALVSVFRIVRDPTTSQIAVSDAVGTIMSLAQLPDPLTLRVEVAPASAMKGDSRYYLRIVATIGTIAERDIHDAGAAVFGRDDGNASIGSVGRMIFSAVMQATDYLQSVSSEARSSLFRARDLVR